MVYRGSEENTVYVGMTVRCCLNSGRHAVQKSISFGAILICGSGSQLSIIILLFERNFLKE